MKRMFSTWRSKYIDSFKENHNHKSEGRSIFSDIPPEKDKERLIAYRGKSSFVIMNLYPYNPGHIMVIPYLQTPSISGLNSETKLEIMNLIDLSITVLTNVCSPHGFNVGVNLGEIAGGSVSEHIHFHVVPRWNGDTNFMPVLNDTKIINSDIQELYIKIKHGFEKLCSGN